MYRDPMPVLWHIAFNGYTVESQQPGVLVATDHKTNERFVVTGEDAYDMACELAIRLGLELDDG